MRTTHKNSKFFSCLSLFLLLILTSCEGFFTNNDVDEKIRAAIDYANAPYSTFVVSADSNAGTIIPSGQVNYKPTDIQIITFTLKPTHQFIKWNFSYKETSKSDGAITLTAADSNWWKDYITIKKDDHSEPNSKGEIEYTLEIQFIKAAENLLIEPVCSLKPEIKNFAPTYDLKGVSREEQIKIEFNSSIDIETLFFTQTEINAITGITNILKNDQNQIYAYEKDNKRYFKNIEILLGSTELNVNDCYGDFSYRQDINTLFITPKKPVEIVGDVVEVKVHFLEGIKNLEGATLTDTVKVFCVNKSTNQKADIAVKLTENSLVQNNKIDAFVDQEIAFPVDDTLQFLYWKITAVNSSSLDKITIYNDSDKDPVLKFCANTVILSSEGVTITAVYKKRPAVALNGFTPADNPDGIEKDSQVKIIFDQPIVLQSFIDNYSITCNGYNAKDYFETPVLDSQDTTNKTILIYASSDSTLDVEKNTTKKITVTIPDSIYYVYDDGVQQYHITAGKESVHSYRINSDTRDKSYIDFTIANSAMGSFTNPNRNYYCIGDTFTVLYTEPAYGQTGYQKYQFFGWKIPQDISAAIECKQSEVNPLLYEFKIKGQFGSASEHKVITADIKERLQVIDFAPLNTTDGVPKNSDIKITFNYEPSLEDCKSLINISYNGNPADTYFPQHNDGWTISEEKDDSDVIIGYKLVIKADSSMYLPVSNKGMVTVTIDNNLTYTDADNNEISISELNRVKSYCVKDETLNKATITFGTQSSEGTLVSSINGEYSVGKSIPVKFVPQADYKFLYWYTDDTDEDNPIISFKDNDKEQVNTVITVNKAEPVTLYAKCVKKLQVVDFKINGNAFVSNNVYEKNSSYSIEFNVVPDSAVPTITLNNQNVNKKFTYTWSENILTITAKEDQRLSVSSEQILTISISDTNTYYTSDSINSDKIYLEQPYEKNVSINHTTLQKAKVQINWDDSYGTIKNNAGDVLSKTVNEYSLDEIITLNFTTSDDYDFVCWQVTGSQDDKSKLAFKKNSINIKNNTITVNGSTEGTVIIEPYCKPKLKISNITINGERYEKYKEYPRDSDVVITFNHALDSTVNGNVQLKYGNIDYLKSGTTELFETVLNEDKDELTIRQKDPDGFIPGFDADNKTKTLNIQFTNSKFYYEVPSLDGVNRIKLYLEDNSDFDYLINFNSKNKIKVHLRVLDSNNNESIKYRGYIWLKSMWSGNIIQRDYSNYNYNEVFYLNYGEPIAGLYSPCRPYDVSFVTVCYGNASREDYSIGSCDWAYNQTTYTPKYTHFHRVYENGSEADYDMYIRYISNKDPCFEEVTNTSDGFPLPCDTPITIKYSTYIDANKVCFEDHDSYEKSISITLADGTDISNYYVVDEYAGTTDEVIIRPKIAIRQFMAERGVSLLRANINIDYQAMGCVDYARFDEKYYFENQDNGFYNMEYYSFPFYIDNTVANTIPPYDNYEFPYGVPPGIELRSYSDVLHNGSARFIDDEDETINNFFVDCYYDSNPNINIQGTWASEGFTSQWNAEIEITALYKLNLSTEKLEYITPKTIKIVVPPDPTGWGRINCRNLINFRKLGFEDTTIVRIDVRHSNTACGNVQEKSFYYFLGEFY